MSNYTIEEIANRNVTAWMTINWCDVCHDEKGPFVVLCTDGTLGDHYVLCYPCMDKASKFSSTILK